MNQILTIVLIWEICVCTAISSPAVCPPVPLCLAATWNEELARQAGAAFHGQPPYFNNGLVFDPNINIVKHPLDGCNAAYLGEDPLLASRLHNARLRGQNEPADANAQREIAGKVAAEGIVLLKNAKKLLPLDRRNTVALIGPFADSNRITGSSTLATEQITSIRKSLEDKLGNCVIYTQGCSAMGDDTPKPLNSFACSAEYFNNQTLEGQPALVRQEKAIQKLSFKCCGAAAKAEGYIGWGFGFDGQSSLLIHDNPGYGSDEDFTWSFWVNLKDPNADKQASLFSGYIRQRIEVDVTPISARFLVHNGNREVVLNYEIPVQQWVSVVVTRNKNNLSIWLNGQKKAETSMPGSIPAFPMALGGSFKGDKKAVCVIDEFCMYDRAISEAEINQITSKQEVAQGRIAYLDGEDPTLLIKQQQGYDGITDINTMSARWTGLFVPRTTGKYHFILSSNGGLRLFFNDKKMFDQMQPAENEAMDRHCWVTLEKGRQYNMKIEYANTFGKLHGGNGFVIFEYFEPGDISQFIAQAAEAAKKQDIAIVAVGVPQDKLQSANNDNECFELPGYQADLIEAVVAANPRTVVILCSAGGVEMVPWLDKVPAVLEAFFPGQEGAAAITQILYGDVNPSGKLPVTYAALPGQLEDEPPQPADANRIPLAGYRMFDKQVKEPLFPFGFGLSYTLFQYSDLKIEKTGDHLAKVSFAITNIGSRSGAETAQVYVVTENAAADRPVRELKEFAKVTIEPGQTKTIDMTLDAKAFSYFSPVQQKWIVEPGKFNIEIGASSRDIRLKDTVAW